MNQTRKFIDIARRSHGALFPRRKTGPSGLPVHIILVWLTASLIFLSGCDIHSSKDWGIVTKKIRSKYPTVSHLSTEEVHDLLERQKNVKLILLDTREPEEYAVSHLPGAHLATTEEEALRVITQAGEGSQIIAYCSVGFRSSIMAKKLQSRGITNVFNMEGSIFKWANEGRELYQDNRQVTVVHPYNSKWKQMLNKELWSESLE